MPPSEKRLVAIVIPWFGREQRGGAEQQAWQLAARLAGRGYAIEVLTTCCASFLEDWSTNHLPAGVTTEPEGFSTRRFPVETRNQAEFDRVCGHLLSLRPSQLKPGVSPITASDEQIFREHLIRCPALLSYLATDGGKYASFIFLPYLYGPILDGLPLVASRAYLMPCLHDESYAYLRCTQNIAHLAKGLLWLSEGEFELGRRLFGPCVLAKSTIGLAGVEEPAVFEEHTTSSTLTSLLPFVLLLGRKDPGKGTLLAVEAFKRHRESSTSALNLIIAGPGGFQLGDSASHIHDLGLVDEATRAWLLKNAVALIQPSPNESFSRVIFESWQYSRPVVVRKSCLATACAVTASQGGWTAEATEEWVERLRAIEALSPAELHLTGQRGCDFGKQTADWTHVMQRLTQVLGPAESQRHLPLRMRCRLTSRVVQHVRILVDNLEAWRGDLGPDSTLDTGWLHLQSTGIHLKLEFETDKAGQRREADPRTLGFRLIDLELDGEGAASSFIRFTRGWNRSELGPGRYGHRWSTGSAQAVIDLNRSGSPRAALHQVLPNLGYGDAIGNFTLWIRDRLQELGFNSEVFAQHIAPEMLSQAYPISAPEHLPGDAALIYHHSIGTEITPWLCVFPGPKALIYHNITPAEFFEPYRPEFSEVLRRGRQQLVELAPQFPLSVGVSRFNARELTEQGFQNPEVLPLCIDPGHWNYPPDERLMTELQDGRTNILFVGRIAPNKRQEELIYTFKFWLEDDPSARLYLVGTAEVSSFYRECLTELVKRLRVDHAVHFVGHVNDAQLQAYYRCATQFWCMSEHEGFCVPLIEACAFGIPVAAKSEGAVPETLGAAGKLFPRGSDPSQLARDLFSLTAQTDTRKLLDRVERYSPANVTPSLLALVHRLIPIDVASKS